MDEYSAFIQDAWRASPTLTINAGVRWDVQMPFAAVQRHHDDARRSPTSAASPGLGTGDIYNACNFFHPGAPRRQDACNSIS